MAWGIRARLGAGLRALRRKSSLKAKAPALGGAAAEKEKALGIILPREELDRGGEAVRQSYPRIEMSRLRREDGRIAEEIKDVDGKLKTEKRPGARLALLRKKQELLRERGEVEKSLDSTPAVTGKP